MLSVRTFPSRSLFLSLLATMLFVAGNSFGFVKESSHWTLNRTVVMHLSLGGVGPFPDGFASFDESAADALNLWNNYLVHMRFAPVIGSTLPPASDDGDNSAFFSNTVYGKAFGKNVIAVTLITSSTTTSETDVIFNSAESWDSYRGELQNRPLDFHRVALHEFGHVVGLDHPDQAKQKVVAIMNSVVGNLDALASDDAAGAQSIYNAGPSFLTINPAPNLVNLSTRGFVGTGNNVLIGGFIIEGSSGTYILRAIGHSLAAAGLSNAISDPQVEIHDASGSLLTQNDDWVSSADAETIASYRLDPSNSHESAILRTFAPGNYTAIVKAFDNGDGKLTGNGLFELYDLHTTAGRSRNISTRGQVLTGDDIMIAGFIIGGNQAKELIVRGIGPSLAGSGITNPLANPTIELHDASGALILSNDNWQSDPNAARVQEAGLAPSQPVESAFDATLNPGAYTVIMRGVNGGTGVGLIEVYDQSQAP